MDHSIFLGNCQNRAVSFLCSLVFCFLLFVFLLLCFPPHAKKGLSVLLIEKKKNSELILYLLSTPNRHWLPSDQRKFIRNTFLRAPTATVTWCDVTKTNVCAHKGFIFHVSVLIKIESTEVGLVWIFFGVSPALVLLNSLLIHLFTTLHLLNPFAGNCGLCELRTCTDECFHYWSAVLLITSTNFKYVRVVYCLSDHLIWIIHSVETPTWRLEEGSSISTRSSACSGL